MAPTKRNEDGQRIPPESALAGILALLVEERESRVVNDKDAKKTEAVLAAAGLTNESIAAVTGKKPDAVRKAIQRARGK